MNHFFAPEIESSLNGKESGQEIILSGKHSMLFK